MRQGLKEYPLSVGQERIWFEEQIEPGTAAYNIPNCFRIRGPLDIAALGQSVRAIVERHEVLRTTFRDKDGETVVVVGDYSDGMFVVHDLSTLPEAERDPFARRRGVEDARTPFDLRNGPLIRINVFAVGPQDHVVSVNFHHAISDGWSVALFFNELRENYRSFRSGQEPSLTPLPLQYGEYGIQQREEIRSESFARHVKYWQECLGRGLAPLNLATDRPRPRVRRSVGETFIFHIEPAVLARLKARSSANGMTLFMLLLAAFKTLLYRYTGQQEIVVGTATAGRMSREAFECIGFFVNSLVLRTSLEGNPSFLELLKRVRQTVLDALNHPDVPFEELVRVLDFPRDLSRTPLFQTMFVQEPSGRLMQLDGLSVERINVNNGCAKYDLNFMFSELDDGARIDVEYSTDLFDEQTIRRMASHYIQLLEGVASDPTCPIGIMPILTDDERDQLLRHRRDDETNPMTNDCIHQLFEEQVVRCGPGVALVSGEDQITYNELNRRANRLAFRLRQMGIGADDLVGLCAERSPDMVAGILGILKAGGAYVPLDPRYPHERLRFLINDARPKVIVAQRQTLQMLPDSNLPTVCMDEDVHPLPREAEENPHCSTSPENLAYVIYTSGSTGQPKGVLISHRNVVRLLRASEEFFHFGPTDTWTLFHSFAFDFSVWEIWGALLYGGRLVIVPYDVSRAADRFYDLLAAQQVTVLNQTPSAFLQLIDYEESLRTARGLSLRYVIFGGEALDARKLIPWFERHADRPQLVNMYGITEATVHVTYKHVTRADAERPGLIGIPLNDLKVYILDTLMQLVPIGVPGEICVAGAGVARGYLNRKEVESERFVPNPFDPSRIGRLYRSGDRGRVLANGELEYLGRLDDQVKIRGFRVEPGEIEYHLLGIDGVTAAKVGFHEDDEGNKRLVAYCVIRPACQLSPTELRHRLSTILPDYMVPSAFVFLDRMPLTSNGKLDRSALPKPEFGEPDDIEPIIPRRDSVEGRIAAVWSEILKVEKVGVSDNFFELGGHSLNAMRVVLRLSKEFGVQVSLRMLFDHPAVCDLAEVISQELVQLTPE